jgi:iron complex outermembrane receptor protein
MIHTVSVLSRPVFTLALLAACFLVASLPARAAAERPTSPVETDPTAPYELPPFIVESERETQTAATLRAAAPNSLIVTGREELLRFQDFSAGHAIARTAGVYVDGRRGRDVSLRGIGKEYSQILVDGRVPTDASRERSFQVDRLPAAFIERIELNRSALAAFESQGVAGTLNLVLKRAPEVFTAALDVISGRLAGVGDQHAVALTLGDRTPQFGYLLSASAQQRWVSEDALTRNFNAAGAFTGATDAPQVRRNREYAAAPRLTFFYAPDRRLEYDLDYLFGRQDRTQDNRTLNALGVRTTNTTEERRRDRESLGHHLAWVRSGPEEAELRFALGYSDGREDTDRLARRFNAAGVQDRLETRTERIGFDELAPALRWRGPGGGAQRWSAGIEGRRTGREEVQRRYRDGVDISSPTDSFDVREVRLAAFAEHAWEPSASHRLVTGLRLEHDKRRIVDGAGRRGAADRLDANPSLNYTYRLPADTRLRLGLARTLRRPELRSLGAALDTSPAGTLAAPFTSGNPALRPETALGADLGLEHTFAGGRGLLALNFFGRDLADRIETLVAQETVAGFGPRFVARPQNVGDARLYGLEVEVRAPLDRLGLPQLVPYAHASWLRGDYTEEATGRTFGFANQPRLLGTVGLDWIIPRLRSRLGVNFNRIFAYDAGAPQGAGTVVTERDAFDTLDAYWTWNFGERWRASLSGLNLLASEGRRTLTSFNAAGVLTGSSRISEPNPRSLHFGIGVSW